MSKLRCADNMRGDESAMLVASTDSNGRARGAARDLHHGGGHEVDRWQNAARITHRGPHDWSRKGLVRFGDDESPRIYLTEGTEDALSVRMAVKEPVVATLGVAAIGKAKLP